MGFGYSAARRFQCGRSQRLCGYGATRAAICDVGEPQRLCHGGGTTNITVTGSNFYNVTNVSASGQELQNVHVLSNTQITATVPAGLAAGAYEILVETPTGSSSQLASAPRTDLFGIGPVVTGISPNTGSLTGGTMVTITGNCFDSPGLNQNLVQVYFGPNLAPRASTNARAQRNA